MEDDVGWVKKWVIGVWVNGWIMDGGWGGWIKGGQEWMDGWVDIHAYGWVTTQKQKAQGCDRNHLCMLAVV